MITSADEYLGALFKINENGNIPSLAVLLPRSEFIYNIDLNTRTIESPEFLSVIDDHVSETVYFLVDRFFDGIDLSDTGCIIQYINANNEGRIYQVPFYDIETYHDINKMLIPWCIEGEATKAAGDVTYSIRFFKTDLTGKYITFNLSTLPAVSKIKEGLRIINSYVPVTVTKELFERNKSLPTGDPNKVVYYMRTNKGAYEVINDYNPAIEYYTLTDGYNYSSTMLEELIAQVQAVKRETQTYWFDATKRELMD